MSSTRITCNHTESGGQIYGQNVLKHTLWQVASANTDIFRLGVTPHGYCMRIGQTFLGFLQPCCSWASTMWCNVILGCAENRKLCHKGGSGVFRLMHWEQKKRSTIQVNPHNSRVSQPTAWFGLHLAVRYENMPNSCPNSFNCQIVGG